MNKMKRILALALLIALLAIPTLTVFAKELGRLDVSGPGIKGTLSLTDHDAMMKLEGSGLFDQAKFVKPPQNLGQGYTLTSYLNLDGKEVPFIEMVYYPAEEGQAGYVHYTGRLNGQSLQSVDEWGQLPIRADNTLRDLLAAQKVVLQPAVLAAAPQAAAPAVVPATGAETPPLVAPSGNPYLWPALIAAGLILLGVVLALRRRVTTQRSV